MNIQSFISEQFNGAIWRMEIDELTETVFVEVRDSEEKKVHFGSVNLISGKTYFKGLTSPERWLTGIESAYDGVLLLYNYQSESAPVHKGLIAVDAITGKTLWSDYNFTFDHLSVKGPVVFDSRIQPRKLFLIDIKTGATISSYQPSVYEGMQSNILLPELVAGDAFPEFIPEQVIGDAVHYLEYNNFRIVSLHTLIDGQLNQLLFIITGDRKIYEDLLNNKIQKMQPEAFILHKNHLIYIKNKSELKVLSL